MTQKLLIKGYQVTGLDRSEEILHYARENAPKGQFILNEVQSFEVPPSFDAVISIYALNYVMTLEELMDVFRRVYTALKPDGIFIFNLILEEAESFHYKDNGDVVSIIKDDYVWVRQKTYNQDEKIGKMQITSFQLIEKQWKRFKKNLLEKIYTGAEIQSTLETVGFREVSIYKGEDGEDGYIYFVSQK